MKNFINYLLFGLFAFAAISCSDDDEPIKKELRVLPTELVFKSEGETQVINILAHGVEWKIVSDDWIECTKKSDNLNEVLINVGKWNKQEERSGKVLIQSLDPEVESVEVKIRQLPMELATIIWDRSTVERMNLHGKVEKLSFIDALSRDGAAIYDLVFNDKGMLVQFMHKKNSAQSVTIDLLYDDKNRLSTIKGLGVEDDYEYSLSYANHGKYIPIEEAFNDLTMNTGKVVNHILWMPLLMKDVSKISLTDKQRETNSLECVVKIDGEKGSMSLGSSSTFYKYTFEGNFIKTIAFQIWYNDVVKTYTVDTSNGAILKTEEIESDGSIIINFNNDLSNTMKSIDSSFIGQEAFDYNANLDVIKHKKGTEEYNSRSYEYDKNGNWIVAKDTRKGEIKREISYY